MTALRTAYLTPLARAWYARRARRHRAWLRRNGRIAPAGPAAATHIAADGRLQPWG